MSKFITLTHEDGPFDVNMTLVLRFWPRLRGVALKFVGETDSEPIEVLETPQQIRDLML